MRYLNRPLDVGTPGKRHVGVGPSGGRVDMLVHAGGTDTQPFGTDAQLY
ncbi:hypothetical protein I549_4597 [Mycobacterium avium subsp. avium 2285 (R)]|nr:hypothetical protein I549_4597 [Mycobacterium avium subsp. avium 2285 (R)]